MASHFGRNYVKKYYMGTYLGLLWLPLVPLLDILMRSLLFGGFLRVSPGPRPYFLFLVVGSIGWYFYERTVYWGYRSLQYNHRYFRSIPVPWLPAVTGAIVPGAVQAGLYSVIALAASVYYKVTHGSFYISIGPATLYAVLGLAMMLVYAWTLGLLLAPLVRVVRDVRLLIPYPLAFWYMITPVLYSVESIPPRYQGIAIYNPLTAPVEFIRHGLLQMSMPEQRSIVASVVVISLMFPASLLLFARAESAAEARL